MGTKFATEAELCAKFISALPEGWTAYAETGGYDLVLLRNLDGFQIGVQAKMKFNAHVLSQALDDSYVAADQEGPDCRAVLVPAGQYQNHMGRITAYCGVTVIRCWPEPRPGYGKKVFDPDLPSLTGAGWWTDRNWHELAPARRVALPDYVPDVIAGSSAPIQLTEWKIKALKIAVLLERRGFVTLRDFAHLKLDHRRWTGPETRWLVKEGGALKAGPSMPDFKTQHPRVYLEIAADASTWMQPESADSQLRMIP